VRDLVEPPAQCTAWQCTIPIVVHRRFLNISRRLDQADVVDFCC